MKKDIYKIKINQNQPSSEDIAKHKNFDALLQQFQEATPEPVVEKTIESPKTPVRRLRWLRYAAAAAAVLLLGVFIFQPSTGNNNGITEAQYFAERPFIDPPLENIKPQFTSRSIDANQGGIFEYDNGSKLTVPAAAFTNASGQLVEGEVEIVYREMHDFVDFFLSGIPMTYDSANTKYILESAGMIELYAKQNGERLNMQEGKAIQVELVSHVNMPRVNQSPKYNIYKLNVAQRNWEFKDVDKIQVVQDENEAPANEALVGFENEYKNALRAIEEKEASALLELEKTQPLPIEPIRPQKANKKDLVFDFDVETTSPELVALKEQYGNILWKVSEKNVDLNTNAFQLEWPDAKIEKLNKQDYEMTLINGSNQLKVIVSPVLTGDDFDNANASYRKAMRTYQQQLAQRETTLQPAKLELTNQFNIEKATAKQNYDAKIAAWQTQNQDAGNQMVRRKIINRFVATSFGVWNCDRPIHPNNLKIEGKFSNDKKVIFDNQTAYIVDKNRNTIVKMHAKDGAAVNFNQASDNMLWMVTKDGQIAIFKPEEFKRINKKKDSHNFNMEVQDQALKTEEDVRKVLKFKEM